MDFVEKVSAKLKEAFPELSLTVRPSETRPDVVIVGGECETWKQLVLVGQTATKVDGLYNVVSEMTVKGLTIPKKDYKPFVQKGLEIGVIDEADVVVVGLGITGCGITRELSKYDLKVIAVDMGEDVSTAASKANNGGVHMAGMVKPGTLKAKLSVRGNYLYDQWAKELNFAFIRPGALTFVESTEPEYMAGIYHRWETAIKNGDLTPRMLNGEECMQIEPNLAKNGIHPVAGTWLPSQGKVHPYEVCVKLIENAARNGVKVMLDCTVGDVLVENGQVTGVVTEKGIIKTKYIVNAAGLYGDEIAAMAGDQFFTMHNRKGTIAIIDKNVKPMYDMLAMHYSPAMYKTKNVESKGGGMDLTPSGNILLGPSATEVPDKEDIETTKADLDYTMWRNENPAATREQIIRIYAGARPADLKEDFIVEMSPVVHGMLTAGAIQSPGVGSSPGVAEMLIGILLKDLEEQGTPAHVKPDWNPCEPKKVKFSELSREEQDELIKKRPEYGHVICRCETITEGEILDALDSPVVPTTIEAIKRRTRAGMGRCQGGFCQARVLEILARELGKDWVEVNLKGRGSNVLEKDNRSGIEEANA